MLKKTLRECFSPMLSIALLMLGISFFQSFLTLHLNSRHVSDVVIGWIHSSYYAGLLIASLKIEKIIYKLGSIRAFCLFSTLMTAIILCQALYQEPPFWIIMRFLAGLCLSGLYVIIESWLLGRSHPTIRGEVLSIYMITIYLTQTISQLFLGTASFNSLVPFIIVAILTSLAALPLSITSFPNPPLKASSLESLPKVLKKAPFGFFGCLISGIILGSFYSFGPLFAKNTPLSPAMLMSLTIAGATAMQWPLGKLSDLFNKKHILFLIAAAAAPLSLLLSFFLANPLAVAALSFVLGGLTFSLYSVAMTEVCDQFEHHNITAVTAILLFLYGVGTALGPSLCALFLTYFGTGSLYYFIAISCSLLTLQGIIFRK